MTVVFRVNAEDLFEAIDVLEDVVEDFERYIAECMDEPNRICLVAAKEFLAQWAPARAATAAVAKGETP
jgi:hypothetical protein